MLWSFYNIGLAATFMYKFHFLPLCISEKQHPPYSNPAAIFLPFGTFLPILQSNTTNYYYNQQKNLKILKQKDSILNFGLDVQLELNLYL